ncbi:hypothetical protein Angca_002899 [Angiostrongylus cantonensis]|nr:hypothetical protein Angca_002899 [Angiostrongylus cantonensis]
MAALGSLWSTSSGSQEKGRVVSSEPYQLCLGLQDVFIALLLVMMILITVLGNVLVVLSVVVYKRMRTFTNILLTSLASADLLVGLVVMPMSLLDLLYNHRWPLGKFLCGVWATSDVLLCTASILNLCIISLDRYMAITSPLKYPRTRSRKMAAGLLSSVWVLSLIVCSPPWFVPGWGLFTNNQEDSTGNSTNFVRDDESFICGYSSSVAYRIYSALGSFYIPLLVMLSVYFKIFRVASDRGALMRQSPGTCRLSHHLPKAKQTNIRGHQETSASRNSRANTPVWNRTSCGNREVRSELAKQCRQAIKDDLKERRAAVMVEAAEVGKIIRKARRSFANYKNKMIALRCSDGTITASTKAMEKIIHDYYSVLFDSHIIPKRKSTDVNSEVPSMTRQAQAAHARLQPNNLLAKAYEHYHINGPGKTARGSKEKMVYMRERKALRTIGIVVMGFIVCWMPFFVIYLIEVFATTVNTSNAFRLINEFFLWLGYSNSVLNPIIYTMYNGDFRRCFRDLLSLGCVRHHRRTMSVKKLHQQSNMF